MTKVQKISADLYSFIDEDTNVAYSCKGSLAQTQIDKLNESANDIHRQDRKSYSYTVNLFWELVSNKALSNTEFSEFCMNAESKKLQIPTGRIVFDEKKYKSKVKEKDKQLRSLIDRYNAIIANLDFDLNTREHEATNILREFNTLKSTIINKSEKQFYVEELETITISAEEALDVVRNINDNYNNKCKTDIENKRVIAIENDRYKYSDLSEDDFQFIKKLYRLIDSSAFYDMFKHRNYGELKFALSFDSLEDFIMRDREFDSDVKLELSNSELSAVRYISELWKQFNDKARNQKLKSDVLEMVESLKS